MDDRDILRSLVNDAVKGLLRSIGDAGASPTNKTGKTLLYNAWYCRQHLDRLDTRIDQPDNSETYTTTALDANATYTGPSKDFNASRHGHAGAIAYADQDGTMYFEGSIDNTNWDIELGSQALTGGSGAQLVVQVPCRYIRAKYVNGANAQSTFRFGGRYFI